MYKNSNRYVTWQYNKLYCQFVKWKNLSKWQPLFAKGHNFLNSDFAHRIFLTLKNFSTRPAPIWKQWLYFSYKVIFISFSKEKRRWNEKKNSLNFAQSTAMNVYISFINFSGPMFTNQNVHFHSLNSPVLNRFDVHT